MLSPTSEHAAQRRPGLHAQPTVFALQFAPGMPLVAVGAPAASYYPAVAKGMGVALELPPFAEVANAVGAVLGQVSQRVHITVTQPVRGVFRVFTKAGPKDFDQVDAAIRLAQGLAGAEAMQLAMDAGAAHASLELSQLDNAVRNDIDGDMFFEARVTATASGPPRTRRHPPAQQHHQNHAAAATTAAPVEAVVARSA